MYGNNALNVFHSLLLYVILVVSCSGYKVEMTISEDNSEPVVTEIEVVDHDNPPFEIEDDTHGKKLFIDNSYTNTGSHTDGINPSDHFLNQNGVKISGFLGNVRNKRSLDRKYEGCIRSDKESKGSRTANHAVTVETGETIHLPCHECGADRSEMFESIQWLKLHEYPNSKSLYHIKEVVADTHDEEKLNRVSFTLDHTLVIKRARFSDAASYFCKPVNSKDTFMNFRISWSELIEYITKESHLRYFFHVDVIDLKHTDTIDVSSYSKTKPLKPEVVPLLNIVVTTRWHPWTSCSVCNDEGIRKRMGICVIKELDPGVHVQDNYLANVLNFDKKGIPCQSQYLRDYKRELWLRKPNQIQIEACNVPCPISKSKRTKRSFMSREEVVDKEQQAKIDKENEKKKAKKKKVRKGAYLILKCPGISLTKTVNWARGSKLVNIIKIRKYTNDRISMDMFGNLHFKKTTLNDNGIYSCWLKKKMKYKYKVEVKEDRSAEIRRYTLYLCFSFIGDFVVFVALTIVKFLQRRAQRRIPKKKAKGSDDSSDDKSDSDKETSDAKNDNNTRDKKNDNDDDDDTSSSSSDSDSE
ncbi:uncharacterized protein LOC132748139 [Ruditapes philippinarum]|uniref:uncharacterized protein LOC132748139 n=1 Tax=Ruditapes philippinarum TaxID=129788 RepID=UPI00295BE49F|nr:uncharacterized protein LOC132748139 [Ruditapes philippinarum]